MAKSLIEQAVSQVNNLKAQAIENAKNVLAEEMSEDLRRAVTNAINEELGAGGDPPSDYDEDGEQKKVGKNLKADGDENTGDDPAEEGDGPAVVEAGIDDELEDEEFMDDEDFEDEEEEFMDDDDELDLGDEDEEEEFMDDDEVDVDIEDDDFGGEEDEEMMDDDDEVIDIVDDEDEDEEMEEANRSLLRKVRKLTRENKRLYRALKVLKETVSEVNLFNARLAGTQKIGSMHKLSRSKVKSVARRFDECQTVAEVKRTYKAINEGLKGSGRRVRKHRINRSTVRPATSRSMNEGADYTRMQQLAGL